MEGKIILITELQLKAIVAEAVSIAFKYHQPTTSIPAVDPYGDFNWLIATCPGIPTSTLRIKSAAGEIPGVVKVGKRVLYEKAAVLTWLRSHQVDTPSPEQLDQAAEAQLNGQLNKRLRKADSNRSG